MSKFPAVGGKDLIRALKELGFEVGWNCRAS
jgi:predicted RNA binding protein YcfA (HicA-like mRNA interferase family)